MLSCARIEWSLLLTFLKQFHAHRGASSHRSNSAFDGNWGLDGAESVAGGAFRSSLLSAAIELPTLPTARCKSPADMPSRFFKLRTWLGSDRSILFRMVCGLERCISQFSTDVACLHLQMCRRSRRARSHFVDNPRFISAAMRSHPPSRAIDSLLTGRHTARLGNRFLAQTTH